MDQPSKWHISTSFICHWLGVSDVATPVGKAGKCGPLCLVAQLVKNLPAVQETRVQSLGLEDPLEKEMATHSSILAWKISWTEEPGGLHPWCRKESDTTEQLTHTTYTHMHSGRIRW